MSLDLLLRTRFDAVAIRTLVAEVDPGAATGLIAVDVAELAAQAVRLLPSRLAALAEAAARRAPADADAFRRALLGTDVTPSAEPLRSSAFTAEALGRFLESRKPVLWVGAGLSIGAGYPSTAKLVEALRQASEDTLPDGLPFFQLVDAYVDANSKGDLQRQLQRLLAEVNADGSPRRPTSTHTAIARLAGAGRFRAIVTTNYDALLETALREAGVDFLHQTIEDNAHLPEDGPIRLFKLHGSRESWERVVLSGESYAQFGRRYPVLTSQLDVLLLQNPVLFAGSSMQDPRILDWLGGVPDRWVDNLQPWRAVLTVGDAAAATGPSLRRGKVRAWTAPSHGELGAVWSAVAAALPAPAFRIELRGDAASYQGHTWTIGPLAADPALLAHIGELQTAAFLPFPLNERGEPLHPAEVAAVKARGALVGRALQEGLFAGAGAPVLRAIEAAVAAQTPGRPPALILCVHGDDEAAERCLALPWELLVFGADQPALVGRLDLIREAFTAHAPPPAEARPLSVVVCVAAPEQPGVTRLDHEEESWRLHCAMGEAAERLRFTDLGSLDALLRRVGEDPPLVVHFTGHGSRGALLFEDEVSDAQIVPTRELIRGLDRALTAGETRKPRPRLFWLASCHGADPFAAGPTPAPPASRERLADPLVWAADTHSSTAATLHREGFEAVLAWFGPVGDQQSTRVEAEVYQALARGRSLREATRAARLRAAEPLEIEGGRVIYPLGAAQLALYQRGTDGPLALSGEAGEVSRRPLRQPERLDRTSSERGVFRLRWGFIGRRRQRARLLRGWRKEGLRLSVITGLGGLGKSALCTEMLPALAREVGRSAPTLTLNAAAVVGAPNPNYALWEQVAAWVPADDKPANEVLTKAQKGGVDAAALAHALLGLARAWGGLLVYLDNGESLQEEAGGEVQRWALPAVEALWGRLVEATRQSPHGPFGLLVSSRYRPAGTRPAEWLELHDLPPMDLVRMMRWFPTLGKLPAGVRDGLVKRVNGHARTIEHLDALLSLKEDSAHPAWWEGALDQALAGAEARVDADILLPRLLAALPAAARDTLAGSALLFAPAPLGAIEAVSEKAEAAHHLRNLGLLTAWAPLVGEGTWFGVHPLVVRALGSLPGGGCGGASEAGEVVSSLLRE